MFFQFSSFSSFSSMSGHPVLAPLRSLSISLQTFPESSRMVPVSENRIFLRFRLLFGGKNDNLNLIFAVAAFRVRKLLRNIGFSESSGNGESSKYASFAHPFPRRGAKQMNFFSRYFYREIGNQHAVASKISRTFHGTRVLIG